MKNLVLDVNVILDLWLNRVHEEDQLVIAGLLADAQSGTYQCWVSSSSLPVLEYITRKELEKAGMSPSDAIHATRALIAELLNNARTLSNFGFHQTEATQLSNDLEDAQIVLAASSLQSPTAIVTNEKRFQTGEKIEQVTPKETKIWLQAIDNEKAIDFIDLKTQQDHIRPALENNIHRVLHHGQYIMGPEIKQLEERLADYVGVKHCITVSDGTKALLIAMMALGIKPGDEVITTPFTFIATGEMIALLGAIPVFVDIDPRTYNIDPNKIEAAITPKTKVIMPVSLYGQCADFDAINAIAAKHNLPVIEDGAQSFGATYKGKKSCGLSTIGSTSFFPSKPLGCYGDGGALFTNEDTIAKTMREIRVHGQDRRYHHSIIGINGRMDTLQAAIVLAKLDIFDEEVKARADIGARYNELINSTLGTRHSAPGVTTPYIEPHNTSVYAQYTVLVENREAVQKTLNEAGIPTAVHYPIPLNLQPAFAYLNKPAGSYPVAEESAKRVMSLPMSPELSFIDQQKIVGGLPVATAELEANA